MFIKEPQPHKLQIVQRHITQTPSTKNPRPKNHTTDRIPKTPTLKPPCMKKNEERNKEKSTAMLFQNLQMPFFQKGTTHIVVTDCDQ